MRPILVVGLLLALGCRRTQPADTTVQSPTSRATTPTQTSPLVVGGTVDSVTLHRGECFRSCAVYTVTVTSNGEIRFHGRRFVSVTGTRSATIPRSDAVSLLNEIRNAKLEAVATAYTSGASSCGDYAPDLPTVVMTVSVGGRSTKITQDYGCSAAPRQLRQLHNRIDEVANTERWIGQR